MKVDGWLGLQASEARVAEAQNEVHEAQSARDCKVKELHARSIQVLLNQRRARAFNAWKAQPKRLVPLKQIQAPQHANTAGGRRPNAPWA